MSDSEVEIKRKLKEYSAKYFPRNIFKNFRAGINLIFSDTQSDKYKIRKAIVDCLDATETKQKLIIIQNCFMPFLDEELEWGYRKNTSYADVLMEAAFIKGTQTQRIDHLRLIQIFLESLSSEERTIFITQNLMPFLRKANEKSFFVGLLPQLFPCIILSLKAEERLSFLKENTSLIGCEHHKLRYEHRMFSLRQAWLLRFALSPAEREAYDKEVFVPFSRRLYAGIEINNEDLWMELTMARVWQTSCFSKDYEDDFLKTNEDDGADIAEENIIFDKKSDFDCVGPFPEKYFQGLGFINIPMRLSDSPREDLYEMHICAFNPLAPFYRFNFLRLNLQINPLLIPIDKSPDSIMSLSNQICEALNKSQDVRSDSISPANLSRDDIESVIDLLVKEKRRTAHFFRGITERISIVSFSNPSRKSGPA
jgi:hypothetical protein